MPETNIALAVLTVALIGVVAAEEAVTAPTNTSKSSATNALYLKSIIALATLGLIAVVTIFILRPDKDNTALITSILGFVAPPMLALLGFMLKETHEVVNHRMDEFKEEMRKLSRSNVATAHSEGLAEGKAEGVATADARTDVLAANTKTP